MAELQCQLSYLQCHKSVCNYTWLLKYSFVIHICMWFYRINVHIGQISSFNLHKFKDTPSRRSQVCKQAIQGLCLDKSSRHQCFPISSTYRILHELSFHINFYETNQEYVLTERYTFSEQVYIEMQTSARIFVSLTFQHAHFPRVSCM